MAELTHLNEASVVHNLHTRYKSDLIYVRARMTLWSGNALTVVLDLLRSVFGYSQPVLSLADIHE